MLRFMYRAQMRESKDDGFQKAVNMCDESIRTLVGAEMLMTATLYGHKSQLYLYYECIGDEIEPEKFLEPLDPFLVEWPGLSLLRKWVPMYDIFHFDVPLSREQWKRKLKVEKRAGRLALVKPDMLSSYIFYHYQLQEERRDTGNKYCVIGLYENLIFHYEEHPIDTSAPSFVGRLDTLNTPKDWKKLMDPHFIPQKNAAGETVNFINMEPLISY